MREEDLKKLEGISMSLTNYLANVDWNELDEDNAVRIEVAKEIIEGVIQDFRSKRKFDNKEESK